MVKDEDKVPRVKQRVEGERHRRERSGGAEVYKTNKERLHEKSPCPFISVFFRGVK